MCDTLKHMYVLHTVKTKRCLDAEVAPVASSISGLLLDVEGWLAGWLGGWLAGWLGGDWVAGWLGGCVDTYGIGVPITCGSCYML